MKSKTAITILVSVVCYALFFFTFSFAQTPGEPFPGGDHPVVVRGKVDKDLYSELALNPSVVEIRQPSVVSLLMLNPDGTPRTGRKVQLYIDGNSQGITITQPGLSDSNGEASGSIYSTIPGSYLVCARDITEGYTISILDCENLYVTPVPTPSIFGEPLYTKGTSNTILWDISGPLTYQYITQASNASNFKAIVAQSTWISAKGYTYRNLSDGQIYFYRVKAKNIYGGEGTWSNYVFSVQDGSGPQISVIDMTPIGDNNTDEWDEDFVVTIKYRIKDNVGVGEKDFWCIASDGSKRECPYTHNTVGDFWEVSFKLKDLELVHGDTLLRQYGFCVEAKDLVGNVTRNCTAKLNIPLPEVEKPKPPKPPEPPKKPQIIEDAEKIINEVIDNTIGKLEPTVVQDSNVTATVTNLAITVSMLMGGIGSLPYFLLQVILALLSLLGFRKKGNPSGYVYDSVTKEPIAQAIVRVFNENNELVWTDVTNGNGYFTSIEIEDGEYYLKVTARNYVFPSKIVFGSQDFPLENVYHGSDFLTKERKIPDFSIPMDRVEMKEFEKKVQRLLSRTKYVWKTLHVLFFLVGLIVSLYALSVTPMWWNYLIVALYVPALVMLLFSISSKREKYGTVKDEKKKLLAGAIIGLREEEFDKLVSKRVTDHRGKYRFVVEPGLYSIVLLNSDLRLVTSKDVSHIKATKKGANIICPNLVVKKLEDTTSEDVEEPLGEL